MLEAQNTVKHHFYNMKSKATASRVTKKRANENGIPLSDNNLECERLAQTQKKENTTGLPNALQSGIESLSGVAMNDVKVHYNSEKPAQIKAQAYAQGSAIHLSPDQEQHLPNEAWHVVQQKQGRVQPTQQRKEKTITHNTKKQEQKKNATNLKSLEKKDNDSTPDEHKN